VRGFLSAKQLGLGDEFVVADGALLVRRLFQVTGEKKYRFAFMPHVHYAKFAGSQWQEVCQQIGFHYIDPCLPTEQVLSAISQTEVILAEAMHGAIVADALRVPWIPITTSPRILSFKWQDWCSAIGVEYRPRYIMPLLASYLQYSRGMRSFWRALQHWGNCLWQGQVGYLSQSWGDTQRLCANQLLGIAKTARPCLSNEVQVERLTVELESRLEQFKTDLGAGKF
jgi:succinoglycan biosynthesis protein ExoV